MMDADQISKLLMGGASIEALAQVNNVTQAEIVDVVNRAAGALDTPAFPATQSEETHRRNLAICDAYRQGVAVIDLACDWDMPPSSVYLILARYGANKRSRTEVGERFGLQARNREIAQEYAEGVPICDLMEKYLLGKRAIQQIANKAGAFRPSGKAETSARYEKMCDLYSEHGQTLEQIGQEFGITRERVRQILKMNGIEERHWGVMSPVNIAKRERKDAREREQAERRAAREAERKQAREYYDAGLTYNAIAEKMGHPTTWVQIAIWKTGGPNRNWRVIGQPKRKLNDEDRMDIARRYEAGESAVLIGKDYDIVPPYVQHVAALRGVRRPSRAVHNPANAGVIAIFRPVNQRLSSEQQDEIARRYRAGEKDRALADEFGVHPSYVRTLAQRRPAPREEAMEPAQPANDAQQQP